ncbi:hypothetical protein [Streptomyces sp. MspMP-M5]|uniref:hypothetical protein n=1 Tax=unclassified Streptomyces TaxID=2593676 RepID=UPI000369C1D2|nr:hypothetical protein [Streptomyces sp. MspMP-M5]
MLIDYDGRRFRKVTAGPDAPIAHYRQQGDLLWGSSAGGDVRRGSLTGVAAPDGTLTFAYTMVLTSGRTVAGHCVSVPEVLPDGRVRLHETWERYGPDAATGTSCIEELAATDPLIEQGPSS